MAKKNDGIGAILGKSRLWFTFDADAQTLSWAKKQNETPQATIGVKELKSVEPWARNLSDEEKEALQREAQAQQTSAEEESEGNRPPSGRPDSSRATTARSLSRTRSIGSSIGARIRSISPFRKKDPGAAEHGLIVRLLDRTLDLTCESKLQADQWLCALRAAAAKNGSEGEAADDSKPQPTRGRSPPRTQVEEVETCQIIAGQTSDDLSPKSSLGSFDPAPRVAEPAAPRSVRSNRVPPAQALVMEDLDDGQLHEIQSPKAAGELQLLTAEEKKPQKRASSCNPGIIEVGEKKGEKQEVKEVDNKKMFDKRELRRRNREAFEKQLATWREKNPRQVKNGPTALDAQRVKVCVRKRPLFPHEEEEFDVVSVRGTELVVHNCLTKADLKSLFVSHMGFHFARSFGENVSDEEVYAHVGEPAIRYAANGKSATIFMFGQTGSGKTHTMQALLERATQQLFDSGLGQVQFGAFEIAGKSMKDLQDPGNPGKDLKVMADLNVETSCPGQLEEKISNRVRTKVKGLKWCAASSPAELLQLCTAAQEQRTTRATQANKVSSRSHSVLRIGRSEGDVCLTLVDCAGSERNEDSTHHSAQDRKDAADINSTIFTLKECFRVMRDTKGQQPPFRDSLLTRVLSDAFTSEDALVVAVGTVSPAARDTEHSIETLRSLQLLQGTQMTFETREDIKSEGPTVKHPRTWTEEEARAWFCQAGEGRGEAWAHSLPGAADGKMVTRFAAARFAQICGGNKELGEAIFKDLRAEMQRADDAKRKK